MVVLIVTKTSFSQDSIYVVNAGVKVNDVIPATEIFQYTEFRNGKVLYRNGDISEGRMNYSRLVDEMLFISEKGDTLALKDEPTIRYVCVGNDSFYFDHGYIMLLKNARNIKLGIRTCFRFIDKARVAAYDGMSSTSSVTSLSSLDDGKASHQLEVKELSSLVKDTLYFLGDRFDHFVPSTRKSLLGFFPDCSKQVNKFCKKNKIDFENGNDLERTISYAEEICMR